MKLSKLVMISTAGIVVAVAAGAMLVQSILAQGSEPPQAVSRPRVTSDTMPMLPPRVQEAAARIGLRLDTSRRIAPNVFLASKTDGELCMITTAHGMSMGCGAEDTFFGANALQYGIAENGKPEAPTNATVYGVARPDVKSVRVVLPSGPVDAEISPDGGFSITATEGELHEGPPTELLARDGNGNTIQRFVLPQS